MSWRYRKFLKNLLSREKGTIRKEAPIRVALISPTAYSFASASLGYQTIYRLFNEIPGFSCERGFWAEINGGTGQVLTIESGSDIGSFDIVAFSVSYELELSKVIRILAGSGIEPLAAKRLPEAPYVICGGSQMISNPLPFAPFFDLMVIGDGEGMVSRIASEFRSANDRESFLNAMALCGAHVPSINGEQLPPPLRADGETLPAFSQTVSPCSVFSNMFLVEVSRGCPRLCTFCLVNRKLSPPLFVKKEKILDRIPDDVKKVGLVGASVADHPEIKDILSVLIERGCEVSLSSLRADRLDSEFATLLRKAGNRMLTLSVDAASERLRKRLKKGVREGVLINALKNVRNAGFTKLKLYAMLGFEDEEEKDIIEFAQLLKELSTLLSITLSINPFIPKKRTPLEKAKFTDLRLYTEKLSFLKKILRGRVRITGMSPKEAREEYLISQGGMEVGLEYYRRILKQREIPLMYTLF